MKLNVILRLAFKNLWNHRLRTVITTIGVMIGISSIIFLVSLGYGLEQLVTNQVANFSAFTVIDIPSTSVSSSKIDEKSLEKIRNISHVKVVSPVSNLAGRIRKADSDSTAETVITAATEQYWKLSDLSTETGAFPSSSGEVAVNQSVLNLIGEDKDKVIGKEIGLDLIIPAELRTNQADGLKLVQNTTLKVVGVIKDSTSPVVFIYPDVLVRNDATKYSSIKIKVDDKAYVSIVRKQLENIGFVTEYVGDTVNQITQVFTLFRIILALFGAVALFVAALGTFNTLTISLLERTREVGLMKALGMRNRDIYKLFITESLIIGVFGGVIGLVLGLALGNIANFILSFLAKRSGADAITLFVTPVTFSLSIAAFSLVVGFVTGWYPSKRAVKIDPLDALRYE